ncbi:GNAT family N-acetyltransferase [Chromobacterium piscinae]|uniref:GNAT family N-acetyltransferase n=1 Tax=Chromobacterium piscinae TaxID=686831 RepID=UPI001C8C4ABC|nr:GNAT family N-acetyltransferase [Chromobacterium piscinae]MBX9298644.1 GNAT family N-acetyltransferase [Chromobacterium vaccinii]MBX9347373.1 GNAT family N-acetyltransferase [Chromobacterium vaccinii]MBX9357549.1 GNAT family N-acetyltransferase [Chromobacterium vaccinii]MCD4505721.1 GNAT family N-acetyltransferase [Chromobacterium piscinae]
MNATFTLHPLTADDFETIALLGAAIWRKHFIGMISREQIDYMVSGRYTPEKLSRYLDAPDRWFRLLRVEGRLIGYCSYALAEPPGEMKLEQLYLLEKMRGRGLGGRMMDEVEAAARAKDCATLMLTVNRHNTDAIAVYQKRGFSVREEVAADIGNGFVMDDYVMVKALI